MLFKRVLVSVYAFYDCCSATISVLLIVMFCCSIRRLKQEEKYTQTNKEVTSFSINRKIVHFIKYLTDTNYTPCIMPLAELDGCVT